MFLEGARKHHDVLHVYEASLPDEPHDGGVHHLLERWGCRAEPKGHYLALIETIRVNEWRLTNDIRQHPFANGCSLGPSRRKRLPSGTGPEFRQRMAVGRRPSS